MVFSIQNISSLIIITSLMLFSCTKKGKMKSTKTTSNSGGSSLKLAKAQDGVRAPDYLFPSKPMSIRLKDVKNENEWLYTYTISSAPNGWTNVIVESSFYSGGKMLMSPVSQYFDVRPEGVFKTMHLSSSVRQVGLNKFWCNINLNIGDTIIDGPTTITTTNVSVETSSGSIFPCISGDVKVGHSYEETTTWCKGYGMVRKIISNGREKSDFVAIGLTNTGNSTSKDSPKTDFISNHFTSLLIAYEDRDYNQALANAQALAKSSGLKFTMRGRVFDKEGGLIKLPRENLDHHDRTDNSECDGSDVCLSVERTYPYYGYAYKGIKRPEGYLVVIGVYRNEPDAKKALEKYRNHFPNKGLKLDTIDGNDVFSGD